MKIAVHITHESARKIGGIGSVLSGVCNLEQYKGFYDKTVFYGPLFDLPQIRFLIWVNREHFCFPIITATTAVITKTSSVKS